MIPEIEILLIFRSILAILLGAIIGYERELRYKPAGLRTHILVCLGSALFTTLSLNAFPGADPARVATAIVIGIGFIGAGTVLQTKKKVKGLTTAATVWVTASIGMIVGTGFYIASIVIAVIVYLILQLGRFEKEIHK